MRLTAIAILAACVAASGCKASGSSGSTTNLAKPAASSVPAGETAGKAGEAAKPEAAAAAWKEITIPEGTALSLVLDTPVASDTSRVEQPVQAHLARPVLVRGQTVLAEGSRVGGVVTSAVRSGKVKGRAHLAVRFNTLTPRGGDEHYTIHTSSIGRTAPGTKKKDALKIGAPAAGGAIIGAIVGGKKGAAIGTAAGGGAGTAVVLTTRGQEVRLPKGAPLTLRLSEPLTVRVRS